MNKRNTWIITVSITAAIFIIGLVIAFKMIQNNQERAEQNAPLKIYNPTDVKKELVDESVQNRDAGHKISDFEFINQNGETVTQEDFKDKIYVADFFFTTCPSICPIMTRNLQKVNEHFKDHPDVKILSHTVWPEVDTVAALKAYAEKHGASADKWVFVTGEKKELYRMARKFYFTLKPAEVGEVGDGDSDFIHTSNLVLVDRNKQIRGFYEGTDKAEVDRLIKDIEKLLKNS